MKANFVPLLIFVSSSLGQTSSSQVKSEAFLTAVKAISLPIRVSATGELDDAGGKLLTEAIQQAQFVLLGETHFTRETPDFAAAVCRAMHPDAYAVEAGPSAAAYVSSVLKSPDRKSRMQEEERTHPANMAFLDNEQENDLAARCASYAEGTQFALWGLDQEFLGAAAVLLEQMASQPNGKTAAVAIRLAQLKDKEAEVKARSTGDFTQLFLVSSSDSDIAALQTALAVDGTTTSQAIMRELFESRKIYRLNIAGSPESNAERGSLLKRHFSERYRALQQTKPKPKILLKFGDNHMWKGFNDTHQLDLGDFVAELASLEHTTSLHIQVLAAKGAFASLGGYEKPLKYESFMLDEVPEYAWLKPVIELLPASDGTESKGIVVDLRRLRFHNVEASGEWQRLIYGYDLLVILPRFSPANLYQ